MKALATLAACLLLAACTTTQVKTAAVESLNAPAADSKGLLMQPDIQLAVLTASGLEEPRADWSQDAQRHLGAALRDDLAARGHPFEVLDPQQSMDGRAGQLLRLHEAVGASIQSFEYGAMRLPTKPKGQFDWTLGEGASSSVSSTAPTTPSSSPVVAPTPVQGARRSGWARRCWASRCLWASSRSTPRWSI